MNEKILFWQTAVLTNYSVIQKVGMNDFGQTLCFPWFSTRKVHFSYVRGLPFYRNDIRHRPNESSLPFLASRLLIFIKYCFWSFFWYLLAIFLATIPIKLSLFPFTMWYISQSLYSVFFQGKIGVRHNAMCSVIPSNYLILPGFLSLFSPLLSRFQIMLIKCSKEKSFLWYVYSSDILCNINHFSFSLFLVTFQTMANENEIAALHEAIKLLKRRQESGEGK